MTLKPTFDNPPSVLPLEPGDRLSRGEFERRYEAMPQIKKAELIEGVVHMPSPTRLNNHGRPHARLIGWLIQYEAATPGVAVADNTTIRLDLDNEPQPDALLCIEPECGGRVSVSKDDFIVGGPELVAEIAASNVSIDLNAKFNAYRRNGVQEYLVWRVTQQAFDWFVLDGEQYVRLEPENGILKSPRFKGLWLDVAALLGGDLAGVLARLREGTSTQEHQAFLPGLSRTNPAT